MPIILADRFGGWPGFYDDLPADERERYLGILSIESQVGKAFVGLGPDDDLAANFFDDADD